MWFWNWCRLTSCCYICFFLFRKTLLENFYGLNIFLLKKDMTENSNYLHKDYTLQSKYDVNLQYVRITIILWEWLDVVLDISKLLYILFCFYAPQDYFSITPSFDLRQQKCFDAKYVRQLVITFTKFTFLIAMKRVKTKRKKNRSHNFWIN